MTNVPRTILIIGPTAGGKSELAVELALRIGGEVISADSMQIYRYMNAGTAKPAPSLRAQVPHHLIDIVDPTQRFTVADWLNCARKIVRTLQLHGKVPIVVGGTNLYIKALLEGLFEGPPADDALRTRLAKLSSNQLHKKLRQCDPVAAERIHHHDVRRMVRAIEVFESTGKPISQWQTQWSDRSATNVDLIGLNWPVEAINRRIKLRVKNMFYPDRGESLPKETQRLLDENKLGDQARQALGYKQVIASLQGRHSLDDAFEQTTILTRRLGKTQRTWLKRYTGVHWLDATHPKPLVDRALESLSPRHGHFSDHVLRD